MIFLTKNLGKTTPEKVLVGVRYFGGYPNNHEIRNAQEQLLAFPQWNHTWPYYTIIRSNDTIDIHPNDQRVLDQEIQLAARLNLKIRGNGKTSELFFINGKGTLPTRRFTVTLPSLSAGSGYYLVATGDTVLMKRYLNITLK